jgi:glycosyltransferase involved in cell wall biosynthesis
VTTRAPVVIWAYDLAAPSLRHRLGALAPLLAERGIPARVQLLPKGSYLLRILRRRRELASADALLLSKIKLSPTEGWFLRRFARTLAFDFDDAIDLRRPRRPGLEPERSWLRTHKFRAMCGLVDLVTAGSTLLAERARPWARRVEVVPTPVDAARYPEPAATARQPCRLVWIGRPENLPYLEPLRPVLARLRPAHPELSLRVVCSEFPDWSEVPVERVAWSEEAEVPALAGSGIGLMPLADDEWTRGKCAFKLLQYMAAGLPCVASPVGANLEVVLPGETGHLAGPPAEWGTALARLLDAPEHAREMGRAGRRRVLERYDRRVVLPLLADLVGELLGQASVK